MEVKTRSQVGTWLNKVRRLEGKMGEAIHRFEELDGALKEADAAVCDLATRFAELRDELELEPEEDERCFCGHRRSEHADDLHECAAEGCKCVVFVHPIEVEDSEPE
jgi:hypothetical protein